ncbi:MAG: VCBS repeat-containing protein, partial [Spirulina sp. DLM2.Bin59]
MFVKQTGSDNPFNSFNAQIAADPARNRIVPAFVDFDRDGDLDVFVGQEDGTIRYLKNIGSETNPQFEEQFGSNNPFNQFNNLPRGEINNRERVAPYFADLTADGFAEVVIAQDNRDSILSFEQFPKIVPQSLLRFENNRFV